MFYELGSSSPVTRSRSRPREGDAVGFVVERLEQHPKDDFPTDVVYGAAKKLELRLITCSGSSTRRLGSISTTPSSSRRSELIDPGPRRPRARHLGAARLVLVVLPLRWDTPFP